MKKYLMIGFVAAVAFSSCSKHDFETYSPEQIVKAEYDAKFIAEFGQPGANQDWGFGTASTRAVKAVYANDDYAGNGLSKPNGFTDATPTSRKPSAPTSADKFYETAAEAGALDGQNNSLTDGGVFFVKNGYYLDNPQNRTNLTIYIDDNMTFFQGLGDCKGNKIVISKDKKVKLGNLGQAVSIYLAPGAELDLTKLYEPDWNTGYPPAPKESSTTEFLCDNNYQTTPAMIYLSAGSTLKCADLYLKNGYVILNDGGTIEANGLKIENNCVLWNEGNADEAGKVSVDVDNALSFINNNSLVYNAAGKNMTVGSLPMKTDGNLVYNDGTFTSEGAIAMSDGAPELVNAGKLYGASLSLDAGAMFYNAGETIIYGSTNFTNSNSKWLNEGTYTSGDFAITGFDTFSSPVWNNCKLIVTATGTNGTGKFHLNRGCFVLEGGAEQGGSLVADSFTWEDTSGFYLGSKSMVNVTGNIYTDNYNSGYGFHGFGQNAAVIKAASITKSGDNQFSMSYYGNLYVDIPNHFGQGYVDTPNTNQPYYHYDNTVSFGPESSSPVKIKPSNCNDGYNWTNPSGYDGRIMAEDLSVSESSDWDFNDVVIDYKINADGTASILLQAAGGTLPLTIGGSLSGDEVVLDESGNPKDAVEVHRDLFKVSTSTMVNTGVGQTKPAVPYTLRDKAYYSPADIVLCVQKSVNGEKKWVVIPARKGDPAGKFVAEKDTPWCDEYANIKGAWSNFTNYVQQGSGKFAGQGQNSLYFDRILRNEPK